jgi:hypothetical protein
MITKNKLLIIFIGLALVAGLLATGLFVLKIFSTEEVKGRVMVVQQNAEVKRLALVKIFAVSSRDAEAWKLSVINGYRRIVDARSEYAIKSSMERRAIERENDSSIARVEKLLSAAYECRDSAREFWIVDPNQPSKKRRFFEIMVMPGFPSVKQIEQEALASRWDKCYEALRNSVVPELEVAHARAINRKAVELKSHDADVAEKLDEFRAARSRFLSHDYLTEIPESVKKVYSGISDDNGDFSIRLPVGDYFLVARGQRRVFDSNEYYYWVRPVSVPSDESMRCLMGNNNMLGSADKNLWTDLEDLIESQSEKK